MLNIDKKTILIVDDETVNIDLLVFILSDDYSIVVAKSGQQALKRVFSGGPLPDLILLDIVMAEMDGYEVLRMLKATPETHDIPVIFVTGMREVEDETKGLQLGAVDYLTKPVSSPIVLARVKNHLLLNQARLVLARENTQLERLVAERTREVVLTQDVTIHSLASLAETRDNETGNHIRRTQYYTLVLAEKLSGEAKFKDELNEEVISLIFKSAPLHDIGKVGIPDDILLKPGKLTEAEFAVMKTHAALGYEALERAGKEIGGTTFLDYARQIAHSHHEKWDGSGYPLGLQGEDIPLSGRIMALADVYDALISKRVYKPAFSHEKAVAIILEGRGAHFDPDVVDAFAGSLERFQEIAMEFNDQPGAV